MKKIVAILVAVATLVCMNVAVAEAVSSPVAPKAVLNELIIAENVQLPEDFAVVIVEEEQYTEKVVTLREEIQAMVSEGTSIVEMYTEEEQQAMIEILPEEYDLTKLQVSEYIPMSVTGYSEAIGDINVLLDVPGEYTEKDVVIAMLGQILAGVAEANDEAAIKWTPFPAQVIEGKVQVTFDQENMAQIETQDTVLVILKEAEQKGI